MYVWVEIQRKNGENAGIINALGEYKVLQLCGVAFGKKKQNIGEANKIFAEMNPTLFSLFSQILCFTANITEWKEDCFEL